MSHTNDKYQINKVLNFIKQNPNNCPPDSKRTAYLSLVRPIMEYAGTFKLEKVQRRAVYLNTLELLVLLPTLKIPAPSIIKTNIVL